MMSVKQSVEWELAGETEVLGENVPQWHFVHHKSHITWPRHEPGPPQWEADPTWLNWVKKKLSLYSNYVIKQTAMKAYGGVEV
jgi:hypothetical protein